MLNNESCLKTQALYLTHDRKKDDIHKYNVHSHLFMQTTTPLHHIPSLSYDRTERNNNFKHLH